MATEKQIEALLPCPFCGSDAGRVTHAYGTYEPGCTHCGTYIGHYSSSRSAARAWNRRPLASAQAQHEALRIAATSCPHEIDHNRVVLHFDPKQPGHNALNQLGRRLASAQAQQALTDLECPPDPEWVARQMQSEHAGLVPNGSGLVPKDL